MQPIKTLLLVNQENTLLIPANHFISLVSVKQLSKVSDRVVRINDELFNLMFGIEGCQYCALIQSRHTPEANVLQYCVPLSEHPRPLELSENEISWGDEEKSVLIRMGTLHKTAKVL